MHLPSTPFQCCLFIVHVVVASYYELYEEGEVEHINVFGQFSLFEQLIL